MRRQPVLDVAQMRRRAQLAKRAAVIAARLITVLTLGAAALMLGVAGLTAVILQPKWLGAIAVILAIFFLLGAIQEVILLLRDLRERKQEIKRLTLAEEAEANSAEVRS